MKRHNDYLASRNLEISKMMDQIDWSVSYYSSLDQEHHSLLKEQKDRVGEEHMTLEPIQKKREPINLVSSIVAGSAATDEESFSSSVLKQWKLKNDQKIEIIGSRVS
jgi:hypothetical protein